MSAKAELKAVLKLDNFQFARNIKSSIRLAKDLARQFTRQPIQTTFLAGMVAARRGVQVAASAIEGLGRIAKKTFAIVSIGAALAVGGLVLLSKSSIEAASQLEQYQQGFAVLLGGMDKGVERMRMLLGFANDKGLRLTVVADASRTLETLTKGALSGARGLEMVGDVAAGTREPLGEMAVTIGRLYDALRTGRSAGAELARLQELGAISGQARRQIEGLGQAQFGGEAWKVAQAELSKYNGMLNAMSQTWEGRMQRFEDSVEEAMRQFGTPLIENLKPALTLAANYIFGLAEPIHKLGAELGQTLKTGVEVGLAILSNPISILEPMKHALNAVFLEAGNVLVYSIQLGASLIPTVLNGLVAGFVGAAHVISGELMKAFQSPIAYLIAGIEKGMDMLDPNKKESLKVQIQRATLSSQVDNAKERVGDNPTNENIQKLADTINNLAKFEDEAGKLKGANPSVKERADKMMKEGDISAMGNESVEKGKAELASTIKGLFEDITLAIKDSKIDDALGASNELAAALGSVRKLSVQGRKVAAAIKPPTFSSSPSNYNESSTAGNWRLNRSFHDSLNTGGLHSGGLATGSLDSAARRTTSLLSFRERRQFDINRRTGVQGVLGHREAGDTLVRSGDRKRMQEFQKEKLREKSGLDATNAILIKIQQRFDEMTK